MRIDEMRIDGLHSRVSLRQQNCTRSFCKTILLEISES
jgi:hypothetical protein